MVSYLDVFQDGLNVVILGTCRIWHAFANLGVLHSEDVNLRSFNNCLRMRRASTGGTDDGAQHVSSSL